MSVLQNFLTVVDIIIWVLCILLGGGAGFMLGSWVGTLLGWMIAFSLDEHLIKGGHFGQLIGRFLGMAVGILVGTWGATHVTAFIAHTFTH